MADAFLARRNAARKIATYVSSALSAIALAACGGGGAAGSSGTDSSVSLATISSGYSTKPTTPIVLTPLNPVTTTPAQVQAGAVLTDVRLQNTGGAQTSVPFTFGQTFVAGQLLPSEGLVAKLADGSLVRLQLDVKATHADGSVRHAIVSGILPALAAGATQKLDLAKSSASEAGNATPQSLLAAGLTSKLTLNIDNVKYTASLADALASGTPTKWLSGSVATEWFVNAPLKTAAGVAHPVLTARFGVRWYPGLNKQARVEIVVENSKLFTAGQQFTYDVNVDLGGNAVYAKNSLTHYHHSRWHQYFWWNANTQPAINIQHNAAYLMASKAVSNYDQSVVIPEDILAGMGQAVTPDNTGPMKIGNVVSYMGMTGGRGDIGPLPDWSVNYLLSMDKRAKDLMLANADGSGSWSMHFRDDSTNFPLRTDNDAYRNLTLHPNASGSGPLPVPRCIGAHGCETPYAEDIAHEPSLAYLPYLVTGDFYYLEEMQFWAVLNPLGTAPSNHGYGQGLLRWLQVRGQAWALRTLGEVAYITPDSDPMKAYFTKQLDNNLNFYAQTYVTGNPNKLGIYDGSGEGSAEAENTSPWQDDYFTWAFGYLSDLGFTKAQPILLWKAKFAVGRMTDPGYCWVMGAPYSMATTRDSNGKVFNNLGQLYRATYGGDSVPDDLGTFRTAPGKGKFIDLPCGSQAQADYLNVINGNWGWELGRMNGLSNQNLGTAANIQPALAVAASYSAPDAARAWTVFQNRTSKPNFSRNPQWDILPR